MNGSGFTNNNVTTIRHFLSRYPGGSPVSLGVTFIPSLAANGSRDFSANLRVPANLAAGNYQYSDHIDDAEVVPESDESNNTGYIFSDYLAVTAPQLPDLVATGVGQTDPGHPPSGEC